MANAPTATSRQSVHVFSSGKLPLGLEVLGFRGRESVSKPFTFEIDVLSTGLTQEELEGLALDLPGTLSIFRGNPRAVHGIVDRVRTSERVGVAGERRHSLRLVPRLTRLRRRITSRVFQDQSALEIVEQILAEQGLRSRLRVQGEARRREYCVQYRESDLAFVTRLLAEEGFFYTFDHPPVLGGDDAVTSMGTSEVVVIGDTPEYYPPIVGGETLIHRPGAIASAIAFDDATIDRFDVVRTVRPSRVVSRDYDFLRPTTELRDEAAVGVERTIAQSTAGGVHGQSTVYLHGGPGPESHAVPRAASSALEGLRRGAQLADATSTCARLVPGARFLLKDHEQPGLDGAWVVTRVLHRAGLGATGLSTYTNGFRCVPAGVRIRPSPPPPRVQQALESAVMVGPPGQEIHVDVLGRVKVRFHWDLDARGDDRSSCWLRVLSPWSGAGFGHQFFPRVGMEVLVGFLGGDVDRPVVLGSLYNATHPPPHALPAHATRSGIRTQSSPGGGGWNEIAFDDQKGRELVYVQAERDHHRWVKHDDQDRVDHDQGVLVGGKRQTEIGTTDDLLVGERHSVTVKNTETGTTMTADNVHSSTGAASFGLAKGDSALRATGNVDIAAGGDVSIAAAGNIGLEAGGNVKITAGGAVEVTGVVIQIVAAGPVTVTGGGPVTVEGGVVRVVGAVIEEN